MKNIGKKSRFTGCALSVRGASHEETGSECQDSARVFLGDNFAVAAVSDGHGSEKHFRSAAGSEMATRVAIRSICDFSERNGSLDEIFLNNPQNAARRIAAHIGLFPLNAGEKAIYDKFGGISNEVMYGATLIVGCLTEKGCFGLQIGDGNFCALDNGKMISPVPDDPKLVGNLTTSLCDSDAISGFRFFYENKPFSGIVLSSDGLINSFLNEDDFFSFGKRVLKAVGDGTANALGEHLRTRSRCGSRDDISVAAVL